MQRQCLAACFLSVLLLISLNTFAKTIPLPTNIEPVGEKFILVDPHVHAWGAYTAAGQLIHWGIATAGADWCKDIQQPCRTKTGVFRIYSMGDSDCISTRFPVPKGGAPMPYCMYFNRFQALHGYPASHVIRGNISHGCVRMHVNDAKWIRYEFAEGPNESNHYQGTLVIVRPY
ncbi:MAG: L,D-transpeptidase [Gammaproteobacteria bacterium]|nr:L,D-transpeptidase [Gammaproteobacteria bacterium]